MNKNELNPIISEKTEGCILKCWIQPRSSRNVFVGIHGDALKIALTTPPVDGKANKELVKFLAKYLKLPKSSIQFLAGETSRSKTLLIAGLSKEKLISILAADK
jgi:uncharacterized protein (TIGR00251 family)